MTTQQIDRELAEKVMGFSRCGCNLGGKPCGQIFDVDDKCKTSWSPSTSRDDCAEVLARLTDPVRRSLVIGHLETIVTSAKYDPISESDVWLFLTATPAQIAEAVWRAVCQ